MQSTSSIAASRATTFKSSSAAVGISQCSPSHRGMTTPDRVAVIGAGPIGLYAAFRLVRAGHRVVIWEKGSIGANVEQWGHVTLFSAMALNLPDDARKALEAGLEKAPPRQLPSADAFLTGNAVSEGRFVASGHICKRQLGRCTI